MNLNFKKLDVTFDEANNKNGKIVFSPLDRGYGRTLGNDLRRTLMNSIPGTSVVGVIIKDTPHEFSRIDGSVNTGTEVIYNLKQMKFKFDTEEVVKFTFKANKAGNYYAKDIQLPEGVECLTPDIELITLNGEKEMEITMFAIRGKGYIDASMHTYLNEIEVDENEKIIAVDGFFCPVKKVSVQVDSMRVGQEMDYEKLTLGVETDGTITPKESIILASQIICSLLSFTDDMKEYVEEFEMFEEEKEKENLILDMTVEELGLTVRPYNCLKNAHYDTVGKILSLTKTQLSAIDQLGTKSINEIIQKLEDLGYKLKEE